MAIGRIIKKALGIFALVILIGIGAVIFVGKMIYSNVIDGSNNQDEVSKETIVTESHSSKKSDNGAQSQQKIESNDQKEKDKETDAVDALKDISNDELFNQISAYIGAHPEKRQLLINYAFNIKTIQFKRGEKASIDDRAESAINTIPILGGMITDAMYEGMVKNYKNALLKLIGDSTIPKNIADKKHAERILTDHAYNIYLDMYCPAMDAESYDIMAKIATISYRQFEAATEDNKLRMSLDYDVFDWLDVLTYSVFSEKDNLDKYRSSKETMKNIYELLDVDMGKYRSKDAIISYYEGQVPNHMFPFDIEETYFPDSKDELFMENSAKKDDRMRLYSLLNGQWRSLITGKEVELYLPPELDGKIYKYPKINYINLISKTEPFAYFNYDDATNKLQKAFITPARYYEDGEFNDVLLLYLNHKILTVYDNSNYSSLKFANNFRVNNVQSAEDVLVKERRNDL